MSPVFTFWQFIIELASIIFIVEHFLFRELLSDVAENSIKSNCLALKFYFPQNV